MSASQRRGGVEGGSGTEMYPVLYHDFQELEAVGRTGPTPSRPDSTTPSPLTQQAGGEAPTPRQDRRQDHEVQLLRNEIQFLKVQSVCGDIFMS